MHTLRSSLNWDDSDHERSVDKLTAFSFSDKLSTMLWRLKYGNDMSAYNPVVILLAKSLKPMNRNISIKVSEQAVYEWLFPFCLTCRGAKEIMVGDLKVTCKACDGVGVQRYTNKVRELNLGGNFDQHIEKIHSIITSSDIAPSIEMRKRLGR